MDKLEPRPGANDRGTIEDQRGNVMMFMAQKEQQVRNVIVAYNRVMGTNFESTIKVIEHSEKNSGLVPDMRRDCEKAWKSYLAFRHHKLVTRARWSLLIVMVLAFLVGLLIGRA